MGEATRHVRGRQEQNGSQPPGHFSFKLTWRDRYRLPDRVESGSVLKSFGGLTWRDNISWKRKEDFQESRCAWAESVAR